VAKYDVGWELRWVESWGWLSHRVILCSPWLAVIDNQASHSRIYNALQIHSNLADPNGRIAPKFANPSNLGEASSCLYIITEQDKNAQQNKNAITELKKTLAVKINL